MLSVTFLLLKLLNKNVTCEFFVRTVAVPSKFKDHKEDNILQLSITSRRLSKT